MRGRWDVVVIVALLLSSTSGVTQEPDAPVLLLVQSELDYLKVGERRISVEIKGRSPIATLELIGKTAGFSVKVQGTLPKTPSLTSSFQDVTVKEVLKWFAEKVGVLYRVDAGDDLIVFPPPKEPD